MTTPVTTSNKTALRASLKKEDESLAERFEISSDFRRYQASLK